MATVEQSEIALRRYYPPERESSGNILNDVALRSVRAVFRKSIEGAIKDGSLGALLDELGYDLVKRPKRKPKRKPRSRTSVQKAKIPEDSKPKPKVRMRGKAAKKQT